MKKEICRNDAFDYPELNKMDEREFYDTYKCFMYAIARKENISHDMADLAINNVLITIFIKHKCNFDAQRSRFSNYLATMVRNACRSLKRRERRYVDYDEQGLVNICENKGAFTKTSAFEEGEIHQWIKEGIQRLRKEIRAQHIVDAFVMAVIDMERPKAIAQRLNVRPAYVSLAKHRCLPRFRAIVREIMDSEN